MASWLIEDDEVMSLGDAIQAHENLDTNIDKRSNKMILSLLYEINKHSIEDLRAMGSMFPVALADIIEREGKPLV